MTDRPVPDPQSSSPSGTPSPETTDGTPTAPLSADEIDTKLAELRQAAHDLRTDDDSAPVAVADRLVEIERALLELTTQLEQLDDGVPANDSVIVEVDEWADLCEEMDLDDAATAARQSTDEFLRSSARAWKQSIEAELAEPTLEICFRRLLETMSRRCEAARAAVRIVDDALFLEITNSLRQKFQECLREETPSPETFKTWMTALSDYADLVLTTIDDLSTEKSVSQLALIEEGLLWHLKHVERSRARRRQLRRKRAHVRAEMQERQLQYRLERRFGKRFVGFVERLVLFLICLVVALMAIEEFANISARTIYWFNIIDACACAVFLLEFFTKLAMVRGRARWFRRHFLIDLIPSIPIGLILSGLPAAGKADAVRLGRLARFLRLPRLARYVRVLRPLLRLLRGFGLLARGLDRLARRYGNVLNQNVILYPTRAELDRAEKTGVSEVVDLVELRGRLREHWKQLLTTADTQERLAVVAMRREVFAAAYQRALSRPTFESTAPVTHVREIPAGTLIELFESSTPQSISEELGDELVAQLARITRIFARPPLRWLPIVRRCVPTLTDDMTYAEVTAAAAQRIALVIKGYYNAWFWVADLYGTVTPSQFVGRVGTMLVNSSSRPAYRLLLFGGFFLVTDVILTLTALSIFRPIRAFLYRFVGTTVMVIGGVCFFILGLGIWLKRVAREATEFYEQSVQAQFLSLTELIRSRQLPRDAAILYDRVLRPGCLLEDENAESLRDEHVAFLLEQMQQSLLGAHIGRGGIGTDGLDNMLLLYRDWLDGALLTDTDTRTTSQLLGNPAIRQLLNLSGRVGRKDLKALQRLDLVRQKALFSGPYIWFNFISRSIAHSVAKLLVDFNQNAIPLDDLPRISADERARYERWLYADQHMLPTSEKKAETVATNYITTSFTALHFLDFDDLRDREVEQRFGKDVLLRLQADRSLMIRRIFGTYPMHDRPKEQRVVNLFSLYNSWLAGGRALLLPWFLFCLVLKLIGSILAWVARSVKEIRHPELRANSRDAAKAHFYSAIRKIQRIRGPVVDASLRLRMKIDPEYLGVPFPLRHASTLGPADVDADLRFLKSDPATLELVNEERQRAQDDMQRLESLIEAGLFRRIAERAGLPADAFDSANHVRAASVAYLGDYHEIRRHLSALAILNTVLTSAVDRPPPAGKSRMRFFLKRKFRRYWREHGTGGSRERVAAWRAVQQNVRGVADALCAWCQLGEAAAAEGEKRLVDVLLHPGRINEQLMAMRIVQSLAILDVLNYRDHIYHLGRYADMGDEPGRLMEWNTTVRETAESVRREDA